MERKRTTNRLFFGGFCSLCECQWVFCPQDLSRGSPNILRLFCPSPPALQRDVYSLIQSCPTKYVKVHPESPTPSSSFTVVRSTGRPRRLAQCDPPGTEYHVSAPGGADHGWYGGTM